MGIYTFTVKPTNSYVTKHVLSHIINYLHVSIVFAIIISVVLREAREDTKAAKFYNWKHSMFGSLLYSLSTTVKLP